MTLDELLRDMLETVESGKAHSLTFKNYEKMREVLLRLRFVMRQQHPHLRMRYKKEGERVIMWAEKVGESKP